MRGGCNDRARPWPSSPASTGDQWKEEYHLEKIRVGLVGGGMAGPYFGRSFQALSDRVEFVAFADIKEEVAREFAQRYGAKHYYTDYRRILDRKDVDAFFVATPPYLHKEMVIAAAQAGKHVLTEKPLALNLIEADEMIQACEQAGVKLGCIFMYRFMETACKIKRAVDEGWLGKLVLGSCVAKFYRTDEYYRMAPWRGKWWGEGGGCLMSQAIHTIDLLVWIMGEVDSLAGYYATMAHDIEVDDVAVATLRFKSGALGTIEAATAAKPGYPRRLEIHGERGTAQLFDDDIRIWDVEGMDPAQFLSKEKKDLGNTYSMPGYASHENHMLQIADFLDAIVEDRTPRVDGREGRRALEVIRAIYQSCDTGRVIKFPVVDDPSYGRPRRSQPCS